MIVPRNRLLFWVAFVVLPFALLGGVEPAAAGVSLAAIGLLIAAAVADAVGARRVLAGITVALPPVVRMSKDRPAALEVRIRNEGQKRRVLRVALPFPPEVPAVPEERDVLLPAQTEWSRLRWECQPNRRGLYRLTSAYLEGVSPFGFWAVRKAVPVQSEIRVYPNLLRERRNLAGLFLHRGAFGLHAQRQVGKGRDFEKLREYIPGDSYDEIHWKATARRGRPITKVFQIERTQEVYVILDASRLSARTESRESNVERREPETESRESSVDGRQPRSAPLSTLDSRLSTTIDPRPSTTLLERYLTAALILGLAAEQQGDLFGLVTFTDKVERFLRARNGKAHYSACRDALYTLEPKGVSPDFDELCTFLRLRLRRRALLVFLTSLDDPAVAENFVNNVELIRRQHLVLVNMPQPAGIQPLFTDPNVVLADQLYAHLGGHLLRHRLRELEKVLQRRGVTFSLLPHERLSAELVSQYLSVKQRQLL